MHRARRLSTPTLLALLVTIVPSASTAHAAEGDLLLAAQMGGTSGDEGNDIAVDSAGNIYTIGEFSGTADFNPGAGTSNLTSFGSIDGFVSKLDAFGNFVWVKQLGGAGVDRASSLGLDASGNIYIAGNFAGTSDFDPGAGTANRVSNGDIDPYVVKLNADGAMQWVDTFGGAGADGVVDLAVDAAANVFLTGTFVGSSAVDFDPGAGTHNMTPLGAPSGTDTFVLRLNSAGTFVWAAQFGGQYVQAQGLTLDSNSNVLVGGSYIGIDVNDFDPGPGAVFGTYAGTYEGFITKLTSAGTFVWAQSFAGTASEEIRDLATDAAGNVYATGFTFGTLDLNPGAGTNNITAAGSGTNDVFVVKLDAAGSFQWGRQATGTAFDSPLAMTADAAGNTYTVGFFNGTVDFDPGAGTANSTSAALNDSFVWNLDSDGNLVATRTLAGGSTDLAYGVDVDVSGTVFVTGYFFGTADFNPGAGTTNRTAFGNQDAYVWKLAGREFASLVPGRLLDTRPGGSTVDGLFQGAGVLAAGSTTELQVAGRGGVPADAEAAVVNVTIVGALGDGFVTVYPCGASQPNASNLNFAAGDTIPNLVVAQVGVAGKVCIFTSAATHMLADVNGFYPVASAYTPLVPGRLLDSRVPASPTVDGAFEAIGIRAAGTTTELQVTGRHGVPSDAAAVVLNITATAALGDGFATVYPCGAPQPNASNLNFVAGDTIPNLVITQLGTGGKVCLFTSADTHLIADVNGYYPATAKYESLVPGRLLDSRVPASPTVDGAFQAIGTRTAGSTTELQVTGRHGVPAGAETVVLNVTVIATGDAGFITAYPCGSALPNASNLNFVSGDTIPNLVITKVGTGGKVCLFTSANVDLIADVSGYYDTE